jgi:hypothetical protein
MEADPRERDYQAVRKEFERIERSIHDHDIRMWLAVEGEPHDDVAEAVAREQRHRRILDDLEKIAHTEKFVMSDVMIQIDGDRARVTYMLQGVGPSDRPMPRGGTMSFVRKQGQWVVDDHHFIDG